MAADAAVDVEDEGEPEDTAREAVVLVGLALDQEVADAAVLRVQHRVVGAGEHDHVDGRVGGEIEPDVLEFGVHLGMVHVLLPYAVLPIYAAMLKVDWWCVSSTEHSSPTRVSTPSATPLTA